MGTEKKYNRDYERYQTNMQYFPAVQTKGECNGERALLSGIVYHTPGVLYLIVVYAREESYRLCNIHGPNKLEWLQWILPVYPISLICAKLERKKKKSMFRIPLQPFRQVQLDMLKSSPLLRPSSFFLCWWMTGWWMRREREGALCSSAIRPRRTTCCVLLYICTVKSHPIAILLWYAAGMEK